MSTTTTVSSSSRPRLATGGRLRFALVGVAASAVLAAGIAVAVEGHDSSSAPVQQSQPVSTGTQSVDPRPDIDQRRAAERFHHR
jgi:hypothetical protein